MVLECLEIESESVKVEQIWSPVWDGVVSVTVFLGHVVPVLEFVIRDMVDPKWSDVGASGFVFYRIKIKPVTVFPSCVGLENRFYDFSRLPLLRHFFEPGCSLFPCTSGVAAAASMHALF